MFSITIPLTFAVTFLVHEQPVNERKALSDDESTELDK